MNITEPWTVKQFEAEVRHMDPNVDGTALKAGIVMLAALQEGTSPERLTEFTKYRRKTVFDIVKRLSIAGVFTFDGKVAAAWFDKNGAFSFWLDVCVALGFLHRTERAK